MACRDRLPENLVLSNIFPRTGFFFDFNASGLNVFFGRFFSNISGSRKPNAISFCQNTDFDMANLFINMPCPRKFSEKIFARLKVGSKFEKYEKS